ncbi:secretory phospholipase A2 receptor-like isoform X2 [Oryzias latipes]
MMEKILLLVLVFSEIFILSHSLVIRQYHLVTTPLNWTDAQTYCRKNYIDLATIESPEEQETFLKTLNITNDRYEDLKNLFKVVWIGLQNEINWRWSDGFKGGITADNYWTSEDQYHSRSDQICLTTSKTNRLLDFDCSTLFPFICYNGTWENPEYIFVNKSMNWYSAQQYCRQTFKDLATVRNETDWQRIYVKTDSQNSWIGLYRDSNIFWSDGSSFSFNKTRFSLLLWPNNAKCGRFYFRYYDFWSFAPCTNTCAFVCYSFKPVKKRSFKIRLKTNGSVNLNDPAVKTELLKQLQNGMSGVELKWTEKKDGTVFEKEERKKKSEL